MLNFNYDKERKFQIAEVTVKSNKYFLFI